MQIWIHILQIKEFVFSFIGKIKTGYIEMMYGKEGRDEILKLKKDLDPFMILNIGNMVVP